MTRVKTVSKIILAAFFIASGFGHFFNPDTYLQMMPPYLPWHLFLIYLSGAFEILFGTLLILPKWTKLGAWGIILLLIAFLPIHVYMALNAEDFAFTPSVFLWLRLPLQAVLIAWAYWHTR
jgi:uncharacterized membrane protein